MPVSKPTVSRQAVAERILKGENLIVYRDQLLKIPHSWLEKHPGGSLAMLHFVGRDATDEIDAFHSAETTEIINKYAIGQVHDWEPFLPPVESGWVYQDNAWSSDSVQYRPERTEILLVERKPTDPVECAPTMSSITPAPTTLSYDIQAKHSDAYKRLHDRISQAGLYQCRYLTGYGPEVVRYCLLGALSYFFYQRAWFLTSALFLGLMWHQLMFFVHDLGHRGVTHDWTIDRLIAILIADFIGGLSVGWWVDNHNVHHLVTNHPSHDPDIEHLPFFAISPKFFDSLYSSYYKRTLPFDSASRFFISLQHKLFYVVMAFARFNLYRLSYMHLWKKSFDTKRGSNWAWRLEILGTAFFWVWFTRVLMGCGSWKMALAYVLVSHAATSPLHIQIVLSHFSMSTEDLGPGESFMSRQLRTTSDVICDPTIEFIHGGLHLQVTHHLFPRLPRHNLREASLIVKEFAKEEGLEYAEFGFVEGNKDVIGVLKSVAGQVGIMAKVANVEAKCAMDKKLELADAAYTL